MNSTCEPERRSAASRTSRSWDFLRDGAGILPASNMADPLRGSNLIPPDLLVRDAVQNSLDERRVDGDGAVRIRFERRVLTGSDKQRFVDALEPRRPSELLEIWLNKELEDPDGKGGQSPGGRTSVPPGS